MDHVNNAAYWCALEELLGDRPELVAGPHRAVVEFAKQLDPGMSVELVWRHEPDAIDAWLQVDGTTHATLALHARTRT
jgi:acyl-ACP thioesterase